MVCFAGLIEYITWKWKSSVTRPDIQVPTVSRDSAVIVDKSKFDLINARSTVATVTASRCVPLNTSFENVSISSAATTILPAAETSALAATQLKHFVSDKLDTSFSIPEVKQHTMYRALMALRSHKSTGADKSSARLLKAAVPAIIVSVKTLINKSIVSGQFPTLWKLAKITPIHTKGPIENKGSYRPISVLCALNKIFERHVHDSLYTYLMSHNMLHDGQSGFRAEYSCETAPHGA